MLRQAKGRAYKKMAMNAEWNKEGDFPLQRKKGFVSFKTPAALGCNKEMFLNCLQESPESILIPLVLNTHIWHLTIHFLIFSLSNHLYPEKAILDSF